MIVRLIVLGLAGLGLMGCISSAPIGPVTPDSANKVATCQNIASTHNAVVVGDFVLGGVTTGLTGAAAVLSGDQVKTDLAAVGAVTAALAIAGTAIAGLTAADFSNSQCATVVGPLPALSSGK